MKGILVMCLCGSLLAEIVEPRGICQEETSEQSRIGCKFPVSGDAFPKPANETLAQNNNTEGNSTLNKMAEVAKTNETVKVQITLPLKLRAKRDVTTGHPFSGGDSGFALNSEDEEKAANEEKRLTKTEIEMVKASETVVEQTTQPPPTSATAKLQNTATIHLSIRHPFSSEDSSFASKSADEAEETTQPPKIRAKRQPPTVTSFKHPFSGGDSGFASKSEDEEKAANEEKRLNKIEIEMVKASETVVEEKRLNETETKMNNETMAEQTTQPPKIRPKRYQKECGLPCGHPLSSNGSSFASTSEEEEKATVKEKRLNETETEMLKGNETMTD